MGSPPDVFLKKSTGREGDLACELDGLEMLSRHQHDHRLMLPEVIQHSAEGIQFRFIRSALPRPADWRALGEGIARMHQVRADRFGYHRSNFIGLNPQLNDYSATWGAFFVKHRLEFQIGLMSPGAARVRYRSILDQRRDVLIEFLDRHRPTPSLLHGDLWSGNVMFAKEGPYLIDPAVYFGDREVDIAMTQLFGGFSGEFYRAYENANPSPDGHEIRAVIYNLYHLLNHLNLFGSAYTARVEEGFAVLNNL